MDRIELRWSQEAELSRVAKELLLWGNKDSLYLLEGDLGSGKTALVRHMAGLLNVVDQVSSPTFSIVNIYLTQHGSKVYHADLYRLKSAEEAWDAGIEEILHEEGATVLIEWPAVIMSLLPERYIYVRIQSDEQGRRVLEAIRNI